MRNHLFVGLRVNNRTKVSPMPIHPVHVSPTKALLPHADSLTPFLCSSIQFYPVLTYNRFLALSPWARFFVSSLCLLVHQEDQFLEAHSSISSFRKECVNSFCPESIHLSTLCALRMFSAYLISTSTIFFYNCLSPH